MSEIDPYEPVSPFGTPPDRLAAMNAELNRVFDLSLNDTFEELQPLLQQSLLRQQDGPWAAGMYNETTRTLLRIALLAERLSKWWADDGRFQTLSDNETT